MSVYKRKSGRWAVLIDVERRADGTRKRRAFGTFTTRKQAERGEREALAAKDRGVDLAPDRVTVAQLLERYLRDRRALGRGEKTVERYEGIVRFNLAPHIGSIPLQKLRPAHVSELVATLRDRGGFKGGALSPKTVKHAFALLKAAIEWGLRHELVGRNVADAVSPPSVPRGEIAALTLEEAQRLLYTADESGEGRWGPFMRLALATGARRGELLAIRWTDVDLETTTLTIRAALSQTRAGVSEKGTKTDRVRVVALGTVAIEALRRQRALQAQDRLGAGPRFADSGHAFQNALGGPINPMRATDAFRELARRIGLSTTSLHALRHTSVSWMISAGIDARTVAAIAGHSTPSVTLAIYSHLVAGAQAKAVATIDDRLASGAAR
jgi:integrase